MHVRIRLSAFETSLGRFLFLAPFTLIYLTGCAGLGSVELQPTGPSVRAESTEKQVSKKTFIPAARAKTLPKVNLLVNTEVKRELDELSRKNRRTVTRAFEQRKEHLSTITQIFKDEGIPQELMNVAFLESGFNCEAKSPAGALGMWQFMKSTANYYGLKVNFKGDERKDIILSTVAAARHLRDLYANYNDWYIALAAYNVGPGGIERAMKRGGTRDFWTLARNGLLPKETARFVPKFLAASLIMQNPTAYGFNSEGVSVVG